MNRTTKIALPVLLSSMLVVTQAFAVWTAQGAKSVSFKAVGPGGLSFVGNGSDVSVKEQGNNVLITIGLSTLQTGIELRDRHMKEKYLETPKYPSAVLTVEKAKLTLPSSGADIGGTLLLHGVSKPVRVHYVATGTPNHVAISGTARINMKEFKIEVPSYLGVTVKPDVDITVKFDGVDRS